MDICLAALQKAAASPFPGCERKGVVFSSMKRVYPACGPERRKQGLSRFCRFIRQNGESLFCLILMQLSSSVRWAEKASFRATNLYAQINLRNPAVQGRTFFTASAERARAGYRRHGGFSHG
jgi:hypothetical protein